MERKKNEKREPFHAKGLGLFKSELKPGGAVYTRLAYFSFGG
jgi:2'-5' RNA ligase